MSNLGRGVNWSAFQHIASMFAKAGEAKAAGIQGVAEGISGGIRMIGAKKEQRRQEAMLQSEKKAQDELGALRMMQSDEKTALDTDLRVREMQLTGLQNNYSDLVQEFNRTPLPAQTPDMQAKVEDARQKYEAARDSLLPWWQESVKAWQANSSARMRAYYERRGVEMPKALSDMSASPIASLQSGLGNLQPQPAAQPIQGPPQAQVPAGAQPSTDGGPADMTATNFLDSIRKNPEQFAAAMADEEYQNRVRAVRGALFAEEPAADMTVERDRRKRIFNVLDATKSEYDERYAKMVEEIRPYTRNPNLTDKARAVLKQKEAELLKLMFQREAMTKEVGDAKMAVEADFDVRFRQREQMEAESRVAEFRGLAAARGFDVGETTSETMARTEANARSAAGQVAGYAGSSLGQALSGPASEWAGRMALASPGAAIRRGDPEVLALENLVRGGKDPLQAANELKDRGTRRSQEPSSVQGRLKKTLDPMQNKLIESVIGKYALEPGWKQGDPSIGNIEPAGRLYMVAEYDGTVRNQAALHFLKKEGKGMVKPEFDPSGKSAEAINKEVEARKKLLEKIRNDIYASNPEIKGLVDAENEQDFWRMMLMQIGGVYTDENTGRLTMSSASVEHLLRPGGPVELSPMQRLSRALSGDREE